ncbi:hypothetical protein BV898_20037, partial [Hypsibius exemplaris]
KSHFHPLILNDVVMTKNAYALFSDPGEDALMYRKSTM